MLVTMRSNAVVLRHEVTLARWGGLRMRIAVLADLHVVAPWTTLADIGRWVHLVQAQQPDMVALAGLKAPLGFGRYWATMTGRIVRWRVAATISSLPW